MTDNIELKSCPFCGGDDEFIGGLPKPDMLEYLGALGNQHIFRCCRTYLNYSFTQTEIEDYIYIGASEGELIVGGWYSALDDWMDG